MVAVGSSGAVCRPGSASPFHPARGGEDRRGGNRGDGQDDPEAHEAVFFHEDAAIAKGNFQVPAMISPTRLPSGGIKVRLPANG